ncbi:unnamed protein product [Caenorhabditis sp. 36 PRJEB53466]|nr:unnamed protein product [Caenorhabditis sp. 36 PRJEB53466]
MDNSNSKMKTFVLFSLLVIACVAVSALEDEESVPVAAANKKSSESSEEQEQSADSKVVKPWKKHDWKKKEPEFLADLPEEAKSAFFSVKMNRNLTKADKTEKFREWATKYDVEEETEKFLADKKADCEKKRQERKENYARLGELISNADAILESEENTWQSANDKLETLLKDENRDVSRAFQSFYPFVGDHGRGENHGHGHGHRFHHGKRFEGKGPKSRAARNIGHGAAPKHHGIGHGAEPPRPHEDGRVNYDPYGNQKHHRQHHGF